MNEDVRAYTATREEVLDRVRRILVDGLGVQREPHEIDPDTALFGSGLGLDSIDAVELALLLEEHLGLQWEEGPQRREGMRTVNSVVDLVMQQQAAS